MDDDPEPTLDQIILESREASEKSLSFGEQKCCAEIGDESTLEVVQHQESGDIGPAVDPESPKKSGAVKDSPGQTLQTESKTSIFRRKDWRDQGQQADLSGSIKSSTTSLRKASRWSNQRLIGQESRRSSQQGGAQQPPLSQKPSRVQAVNEADTKDLTWVSQRTGKVMKCRSQQTSLIWERKTFSEIIRPSSDEFTPSKDEESESTTTEKDSTSSRETASERDSGVESCRGSQQLEGKESKHSSQHHLERSGSRRSSQRSIKQPSTLSPKYSQVHPTKGMDTEEDLTWISQRTGREMKCTAQQTSLIWENKTLSDILQVYRQESRASGLGEEDISEEEEGDTEMEQASMKDVQSSIHRLEEEESRQDIEQAEERKPEHHRKKRKSKIDQGQQTDSVESIKKELADSSQQTDVFESTETSSVDQGQDSVCGTEQTDVPGSRQSSQELVGQDSSCSSPQPEPQDSQRSSQQSLRTETQTAEENESQVPSDLESESSKLDQKAFCISGAEEDTWVSPKTGRTVRNLSQQTDWSWLQYFALKSQKIKRCISQQTDESFLRLYRAGKLKQAVKEHRESHKELDMWLCSKCCDLYAKDFSFDLDALSSFSTMSILSTIYSQETAGKEIMEETEPSIYGGNEEQPETQESLQQESRRSSQQVRGQESPKNMGWESQQGSLEAVDDQTLLTWASESESNFASESSSLYTEGEDKILQTYSLISFEEGIWLNRSTGKLLVSHSQQTSEVSVTQGSGTTLEKSGSTSEEGLEPTEMDDTSVSVNQYFQQEMEGHGEQTSGQESQGGSQQDYGSNSQFTQVQPTGEGFLSVDEIERLVCSRLSEATLLIVASPDMEDEPVQIYTVVSLEKGIWLNAKTGKIVASRSQQTEASSQQNSTEDE